MNIFSEYLLYAASNTLVTDSNINKPRKITKNEINVQLSDKKSK